jgi:hypothetical protein
MRVETAAKALAGPNLPENRDGVSLPFCDLLLVITCSFADFLK